MKKWKKYPLFLVLLISGILITGMGYAGEGAVYADYPRTNGWMTPELAKVFQAWKDGIYPWELLQSNVRTAWAETVQKKAEGTHKEDTYKEDVHSEEAHVEEAYKEGAHKAADAQPGGGTGAAGGSGGDAAGTFGGNGEVQDGGQTEQENGGETEGDPEASVSGNTSGEMAAVDVFVVEGTGDVYDEFGRLVKRASEAGNQAENGTQGEGRESADSDRDTDASSEGDEQAGMDASSEDDEQADTAGNPVENGEQEPDEQDSRQKGDKGLNLGGMMTVESGTEQEEQTWEIGAVEESYFDDALFIGDSRTVGLSEYGGFQDQTTFYAATSLTIYNLFDSPKKFAVSLGGRKVTLEEALSERRFGKIYIMLGINELGRGTTESFFKVYADAVNRIRLLQPDAKIFVQGIMRVSGQKSSTDRVFNNVKINERNQALAAMADNSSIFYLEVNDAVCDEKGDLITEYTYDQIHLKAKYYQLWKDYLLANGAKLVAE